MPASPPERVTLKPSRLRGATAFKGAGSCGGGASAQVEASAKRGSLGQRSEGAVAERSPGPSTFLRGIGME